MNPARSFQAVLYDFSGTLFRLEHDDSWFVELTDDGGDPLDVEARAELMRRMTAPVTQMATFSAEHQLAWEQRDLDPDQHRKVYLEVLRQSGVSKTEQAKALYDRLVDPLCWTPYPDAEAALKLPSSQGLRMGVVSNIAFDIRPAFATRGLETYVDQFTLSFEAGAIKPDPVLFQAALDRLGVAARDTLMIGDSQEADGGAAALGCAFALVEPTPTAERTDALLGALRSHGVL